MEVSFGCKRPVAGQFVPPAVGSYEEAGGGKIFASGAFSCLDAASQIEEE
jgi:hypothetical protein